MKKRNVIYYNLIISIFFINKEKNIIYVNTLKERNDYSLKCIVLYTEQFNVLTSFRKINYSHLTNLKLILTFDLVLGYCARFIIISLHHAIWYKDVSKIVT